MSVISSLPAAPLASTSTVSLVLWQASTTSALKLLLTAVWQRARERRGRDGDVGGEHREHRGHRRREHRRALGHAADGRGAADRRASTVCSRGLGHGVGGHHRLGGGGATGGVGGELRAELRHARLDRVHRHRDADEAGLAHEHVGGRAADGLRGELAHAQRVGAALLPRRRVGVAGVEDHRGGAAVGEVAATDLHRRGGDQVAGEHAGGGDRRAVDGRDHGEVGRRPTP